MSLSGLQPKYGAVFAMLARRLLKVQFGFAKKLNLCGTVFGIDEIFAKYMYNYLLYFL